MIYSNNGEIEMKGVPIKIIMETGMVLHPITKKFAKLTNVSYDEALKYVITTLTASMQVYNESSIDDDS